MSVGDYDNTLPALVPGQRPHRIPDRPDKLTRAMVEEICETVATTPRGLDFLCATRPDFPTARTVMRWLNEDGNFREAYAVAKLRQADLIFDECLEIADDSSGDRKLITRGDGQVVEVIDNEFVGRSALRINTRLRMAGKLAPKKYGDKLDLNATVGFTRQEDALSELS